MRIYVKENGKTVVNLPIPMWVIRMGLSNFTIRLATKKLKEEDRKHIDEIDFNKLSKNFRELKNHKGLKIVDIKSKDGSEVTITV
jgi:hypothetical protein